MTRLAVLGFGLIGGSLALSARAAGIFDHITAIDLPGVLDREETRRAADVCLEITNDRAVERALGEAMLTVLAAPVSIICERVAWVLDRANVVTDCGSTKRLVLQAARRSVKLERFVPGHPMAGLPEGGIRNASSELFRGRTWILCTEEAETDAVAQVENLVREVGARALYLTADDHDGAVARTSHIPQLLASALTLVAEAHAARRTAGPAFERATLIAGGPESVWRDIFATNRDYVAKALRELIAELEPVATELEGGQATTRTDSLLARARELRATRG